MVAISIPNSMLAQDPSVSQVPDTHQCPCWHPGSSFLPSPSTINLAQELPSPRYSSLVNLLFSFRFLFSLPLFLPLSFAQSQFYFAGLTLFFSWSLSPPLSSSQDQSAGRVLSCTLSLSSGLFQMLFAVFYLLATVLSVSIYTDQLFYIFEYAEQNSMFLLLILLHNNVMFITKKPMDTKQHRTRPFQGIVSNSGFRWHCEFRELI